MEMNKAHRNLSKNDVHEIFAHSIGNGSVLFREVIPEDGWWCVGIEGAGASDQFHTFLSFFSAMSVL